MISTRNLLFSPRLAITALLAVSGVNGIPVSNATSTTSGTIRLLDASPNLPSDPNTDPSCTWWWDNDGSISCKDMPFEWGISFEDFLRWNPSITSDCGNYVTGRSYCVEGSSSGSPPGETTIPSKTSTAVPSPTGPSNGINTPTPIQAGMTKNCNKFHQVRETTTCQGIVEYNKISLADFLKWNPAVGPACQNLWLGTYACVGEIGSTGSITKKETATSTEGGNGVTTPTPNQPNMVANCNKFHLVRETTTCQGIIDYNKITMADFVKWNPSVGAKCDNLWLGTHACVGIIGGTPPAATTTKAGNGVSTPTPSQPGMVSNCNKFHLIKSTTLCSGVLSYNSITMAEFLKWNPSVKSDCSGMQAGTYACVNVIGRNPTPTKPPTGGVVTPTPAQAGMVKGCTKFHYVRSTTTCQGILDYNKITMAQFFKWNPAVKKDCSGLWSETHACVSGP